MQITKALVADRLHALKFGRQDVDGVTCGAVDVATRTNNPPRSALPKTFIFRVARGNVINRHWQPAPVYNFAVLQI
jgi:hypothetical protein